jgi:hypothetical protein
MMTKALTLEQMVDSINEAAITVIAKKKLSLSNKAGYIPKGTKLKGTISKSGEVTVHIDSSEVEDAADSLMDTTFSYDNRKDAETEWEIKG